MRYVSLFFFLLLSLSGCSDNKPDSENVSGIKTAFIDDKELQQKLSNRSGRILFINVWATWCVPCVEEFPDLVNIYNEYKDKEMEFLSLSVDFGNNADSLVSSFMASQKAAFPVFIIREESSEKVINLLNKDWSGAIPATFIYDKSGAQKKFILGAHTYKEFKHSIDSVLVL